MKLFTRSKKCHSLTVYQLCLLHTKLSDIFLERIKLLHLVKWKILLKNEVPEGLEHPQNLQPKKQLGHADLLSHRIVTIIITVVLACCSHIRYNCRVSEAFTFPLHHLHAETLPVPTSHR